MCKHKSDGKEFNFLLCLSFSISLSLSLFLFLILLNSIRESWNGVNHEIFFWYHETVYSTFYSSFRLTLLLVKRLCYRIDSVFNRNNNFHHDNFSFSSSSSHIIYFLAFSPYHLILYLIPMRWVDFSHFWVT